MEKTALIYPVMAMFFLTISMIFTLGISRFIAIRKQQVSVKFFQQYTDGEQPERLHLLGRHVQNHFEVPPLFYIGIILTILTDSISSLAVMTAWVFVALRYVHSYIHLGKNNVTHRFLCFVLSVLALLVFWASLFISVL